MCPRPPAGLCVQIFCDLLSEPLCTQPAGTGREAGRQQPGTREPACGLSTLPAANFPQSGFRGRDPGPRAGRQANVTSGAEALSSPGRGPGLAQPVRTSGSE